MSFLIDVNFTTYKKFKFIPPATHTELIDCTSNFLNFNDRKFIQNGLDPLDYFYMKIYLSELRFDV